MIRSGAAVPPRAQKPICSPSTLCAPKRGRVGPFLRKPGNTLFWAKCPDSCSSHRTHFLRAVPSHKRGLEVSLDSVKVWGHMQAHSEFQAQSWAGEGQLRLDRQGLPWGPKMRLGVTCPPRGFSVLPETCSSAFSGAIFEGIMPEGLGTHCERGGEYWAFPEGDRQ